MPTTLRRAYVHRLPMRNYPARGVIHAFNNEGVEIINISRPSEISRIYG